MRVHLSTPLNAPPDWVAAQLQSTAVFRRITAPLVRFKRPGGAPWPAHWSPGDLRVQMWLLGLLPMGSQTVRISIEAPVQAGGWPTLPMVKGSGGMPCHAPQATRPITNTPKASMLAPLTNAARARQLRAMASTHSDRP